MCLPLRDLLWVLPDAFFEPDCALEGPALDEGPAEAPLVVSLVGAIFYRVFTEFENNHDESSQSMTVE